MREEYLRPNMVLDARGDGNGLNLVRTLLASSGEPVLLGETLHLRDGFQWLVCSVITQLPDSERTPENLVREVIANRAMLMSSTLADIAQDKQQCWRVIAVRGMELTKLWPRARNHFDVLPGAPPEGLGEVLDDPDI